MANQINDCKFNFYTNAFDTRPAPNFNGVSQYGLLPNPLLTTGDTVTLDFIYNGQSSDFILFTGDSTNWNTSCICGVLAGNWQLTSGINVELNGQPIGQGSKAVIPIGLNHFSWTRNGATEAGITRVGSEFDRRFVSFPIFNFKINDGSVYNYPMDDGWANNPVMRNTGSGADGTFINMTEASWVEIPA